MGPEPAVSRRGFTLLELIVVLFVLALAVAVSAPAVGRSMESVRARADVNRIAALLRHTREQAITTRRPHALVVDGENRRVSVVEGDSQVRESRALPERVSIRAQNPGATVLRFDAQGLSSGAELVVVSGEVAYRVSVDAMTGRVRSQRE